MRPSILLVSLLVSSVCVTVLGAQSEPSAPPLAGSPPVRKGPSPDEWQWNHTKPYPLVEHGVIESAAMQREVGYNIYIPPEYATHPERRYSVVYFLHGARGDEGTGAPMAKASQRALEAGLTPAVIWVYVNGGPFSGFYDWADSYVKAETMLMQELIPAIESRYRVRTDRAGRAISGYSMGGDGAVRLATKYPERFCAASAIAGSFGFYREHAGEDTVFHWTRQHADQLRGSLGLSFFVGAKDRSKVAQARYTALLDELDFGYRCTVIEGKGHMLGEMWNELVPDFMRVIAAECAPPLEGNDPGVARPSATEAQEQAAPSN